MQKNVVYHAS